LIAQLLERINYRIRLRRPPWLTRITLRRPPWLTRRRTAAAAVAMLAISGIVCAAVGVAVIIANQLSAKVSWAWMAFDIVLILGAALIGWTAYRTVKSNEVAHRGGATDGKVIHTGSIMNGIASIFDMFGVITPSRRVNQLSPWEHLEQRLTEKYKLELAGISGEHGSQDKLPSETQPNGGSDK
jgi:hypothetical protein